MSRYPHALTVRMHLDRGAAATTHILQEAYLPMFPTPLPPPSPPTAAIVAPAHAAQAPASRGATADSSTPTQEPRQQVDSHGYHYIVVGNRLLTTAEVRTVVAGSATPRAAVGALKQAYEDRGYFLVALVGAEHGKDVTLRVIQGRITHVEGPPRLAAFFDGLKENDELRKQDVIRPSILAQAYAATNGQQPQVSFHPAPEPGGSTMQVGETPLANSHSVGATFTTGNFGNRYAARYIAQGQVSAQRDGMNVLLGYARALPGMDEATHGAYYAAKTATFSDVTPLGLFSLDGSITSYRLGEKFAPLFPAGKIKAFGGNATQLLYADELRRWSVHEGVHRIHDATTVFSGNFVLSDRTFGIVDVGSDFSWRFGGWFRRPAALSVSGDVKHGFAGANAGFTDELGSPAAHFNIYTASVDVTQSLAHDYSLKLSLSGQASPYTLPSYEQWVLGGVNNLGAYLPGTLAGDRGYLGRLVAQGPEWQAGPLRLRPSAYVEHGASRLSYIAPRAPVWQALDDIGVGLNVDIPVAHASAILAYAEPLGSRNVSTAVRRQQRAHAFFFLQARL